MGNFIITKTRLTPLFVENLCKSPSKTLCKSSEKLSAKSPFPHFYRAKLTFSAYFSHFSHRLLLHIPPLNLPNLFHYSTVPTINTTNYFNKERTK